MWKIHFNAHIVTHRNELGDKPFSQRNAIMRHSEKVQHPPIKLTVSIAGKFNCHFCPKLFSSIGPLNVHIRTHTGECLYACPTCMRFTQKVSMQKHVMSKHILEPQFKCKVCGKAFKGKYSLTLHEQLHSTLPLAYEVCVKAFIKVIKAL